MLLRNAVDECCLSAFPMMAANKYSILLIATGPAKLQFSHSREWTGETTDSTLWKRY